MEYTNSSLQMILIFAFTKLLKTNFDNEQSESKREFDIRDDQGYWLIFFLLPLFISQFRKGVIICIVAGPLVFNSQTTNAFEWIDLWTTKDQQAKNAMSNEDYEKAKQLFKNENWKASAAYKAGSFDQALIFSQMIQHLLVSIIKVIVSPEWVS